MATFPWINLFCFFLSFWVGTSKRFRTENVKRNWLIFWANMFAVVLNGSAVFYWFFIWVTA
jgi:hypothetical protein